MEDKNNAENNSLGEIEVNWKKPPSLMDLKADLEECRTSHDNQTSKVETWLDNLHVEGKAKIAKAKNRSSVVPKLIRKQAEWRYSALSEPFLGTSDLFKAEPVTFEDVLCAKQNGLILNHQFNNKIDKGRFIDDYVRTAVDEGTIVVRLGWEYEDKKEVELLPIVELTEDLSIVPLLEEIMALKQSNPRGFNEQVPPELQQALEQTQADGVPYSPTVTGYEEVKVTKVLKNGPTLEVCDFKNVYVDPTCNGDTDKANFIVYSFESSKAELTKDGRYVNLDKINPETNTILGEVDHGARVESTNFNFKDEARKKFVVYEYWGYMDVEGDGVLEPIIASWVGNTMIRMESNPFPDKKLPFVIVQYLPVRRSVYGEPDGSLLEDNQQIMGAVVRGMIDVMGRSANGQTGIRRDMLDTVNKRKFERGLDYEFNVNVDPRQGIHSHVYPEIPATAQYMVDFQNREAESLTGVKSFAGGLSGDQLGETATGVRGVLDSASKRELGILRRLASGITQIGIKLASMNGEFLSEEETIRITNTEFVSVAKDELVGQFDLKLSISTAEEDNARAQEISFMLQTMGNNVDFAITQKMLAKQFTLRKMPDLAKDIEKYQPEPDPMDQQIKQLEIQKLQAEIAEIGSRTAENYAEAELDKAKAGTEGKRQANLDIDSDKKALDFVEQESGTTQERDLQKQGAQAEGNMKLKTLEADLKDRSENRKTNLAQYLQKDS
jgi:hypothetical protein